MLIIICDDNHLKSLSGNQLHISFLIRWWSSCFLLGKWCRNGFHCYTSYMLDASSTLYFKNQLIIESNKLQVVIHEKWERKMLLQWGSKRGMFSWSIFWGFWCVLDFGLLFIFLIYFSTLFFIKQLCCINTKSQILRTYLVTW